MIRRYAITFSVFVKNRTDESTYDGSVYYTRLDMIRKRRSKAENILKPYIQKYLKYKLKSDLSDYYNDMFRFELSKYHDLLLEDFQFEWRKVVKIV